MRPRRHADRAPPRVGGDRARGERGSPADHRADRRAHVRRARRDGRARDHLRPRARARARGSRGLRAHRGRARPARAAPVLAVGATRHQRDRLGGRRRPPGHRRSALAGPRREAVHRRHRRQRHRLARRTRQPGPVDRAVLARPRVVLTRDRLVRPPRRADGHPCDRGRGRPPRTARTGRSQRSRAAPDRAHRDHPRRPGRGVRDAPGHGQHAAHPLHRVHPC